MITVDHRRDGTLRTAAEPREDSTTSSRFDRARGHWISLACRDELARWRDVEATALAAFRTSLETAVADAFAATHVRVVFDLDELRERLAIWDAGLDDGVVECVKLDGLREQPAIRGPDDRIRFVRVTPDGSLAFAIVEAGAPERIRGGFEVRRAVVDRIAADPAWQAQLPALFAPGFVSIDRYLR